MTYTSSIDWDAIQTAYRTLYRPGAVQKRAADSRTVLPDSSPSPCPSPRPSRAKSLFPKPKSTPDATGSTLNKRKRTSIPDVVATMRPMLEVALRGRSLSVLDVWEDFEKCESIAVVVSDP